MEDSADESTVLSDSADDTVDSRTADTSTEGMNGVEEDSGVEDSQEEEAEAKEAEHNPQSRKSFCSVM